MQPQSGVPATHLDAYVRQLLLRADMDRDGALSLEEFVVWFASEAAALLPLTEAKCLYFGRGIRNSHWNTQFVVTPAECSVPCEPHPRSHALPCHSVCALPHHLLNFAVPLASGFFAGNHRLSPLYNKFVRAASHVESASAGLGQDAAGAAAGLQAGSKRRQGPGITPRQLLALMVAAGVRAGQWGWYGRLRAGCGMGRGARAGHLPSLEACVCRQRVWLPGVLPKVPRG
jgi:hypothetical protein